MLMIIYSPVIVNVNICTKLQESPTELSRQEQKAISLLQQGQKHASPYLAYCQITVINNYLIK